MTSTFGTYSIAYSGMYVNQAALTTTSTNLANIDTTGASKVQLSSVELATATASGTASGSGVSVASITRSRDIYLDRTYRTENAEATYLSVKSGNLEYLDQILCEYETDSSSETTTTTTGLQAVIDDFFAAWEALATDASSESTRSETIAAAVDLIDMLTAIDEQLQQLQADAVTGVQDGVDSLNELAWQVAALNQQISKAESGGGEASYLRDQRDTLLDQMSALADISVTESNGTLKVTLGGVSLVNGATVHELVVAGTGTTDDPLTVKWAGSGNTATIKSGSIKAYLEDADQTGYEAIDADDIPYNFTATATSSITTLRQALNVLITTLAVEVNALCTSGVDLNGDAGQVLFTVIDSSQPLSITNIQVNPELVDDPDLLVTSASGEDGDNTIASQIAKLSQDTTSFASSGIALDITDFYKAVTTWLGTAGDEAATKYETQAALVTQLDYQRQSVSGISIDEEMSNMIKFQTAYAASARVMSTIDGLLGDLIEVLD